MNGLLTDLYELTMAAGYFEAGKAEEKAAFELTFRRLPPNRNFILTAGLAQLVDYLLNLSFTDEEIDYLKTVPQFRTASNGFWDYLRLLRFTGDLFAMPEGTPAFPGEPVLILRGPVIEAQIPETYSLATIGFQSMVASKAVRCVDAAAGRSIIEFGTRRAHTPEAGVLGARAAYIGGCAGTSNLQAGQQFGIPVSGTQAHSWIMFFENEREAFQAYAKMMPNNCIFLVDTYDSIQGIRHAIEAGSELRKQGHEMIGVRLDSGDGPALSIKARAMLDQAGFVNAKIVGSGNLDEFIITDLKRRRARIDVWGVGTKLSTGQPDGALDGVYKLGAIRPPGGEWQYRIKLSEESAKTSIPGSLQVRRFYQPAGRFLADAIYETAHGVPEPCEIVDIQTANRTTISAERSYSDLLVPIFRAGKLVYETPDIEASREQLRKQLGCAPSEILRLNDPQPYNVGIERSLYELRSKLIEHAQRS